MNCSDSVREDVLDEDRGSIQNLGTSLKSLNSQLTGHFRNLGMSLSHLILFYVKACLRRTNLLCSYFCYNLLENENKE